MENRLNRNQNKRAGRGVRLVVKVSHLHMSNTVDAENGKKE